MKTQWIFLGCTIILLFSSITSAQILSPVAHLEGELDFTNQLFFIGTLKIQGQFQGYPYEPLENNQNLNTINNYFNITLSQQFNTIPLFETTIQNLQDVLIVNSSDLELNSLEDVENLKQNVERFSQVTLIAKEGLFLLGMNQGHMHLKTTTSFAISGLIQFTFQQNKLPLFLLITPSKIITTYTGQTALFFSQSNDSHVSLIVNHNRIVWSGSAKNTLFLINDSNFSTTQNSKMYFFPINTQTQSDDIIIQVQPADNINVDIPSFFTDITNQLTKFSELNTENFADQLDNYQNIFETIQSMLNGALILIQTSETVEIDQTTQTFENVGLARGNQFTITIPSETETITLEGDYKLIFLGDHLYTSQAQESDTGVTFPLLFIIIWIIAILLIFLFKYHIKKDDYGSRFYWQEQLKKPALAFHIIALILTFILMDREISYQFGMSALDALFGAGGLILGVFVVIQIIVWILGYLALALPLQIILRYMFTYFNFEKNTKGITKGIAAFSIWIFSAFYVKLIVNLVLLMIGANTLFPMG